MRIHVYIIREDWARGDGGGGGRAGGRRYIKYPLSTASLLCLHLPINPQAPMKIMTKWATMSSYRMSVWASHMTHRLAKVDAMCTLPNALAVLIGNLLKNMFPPQHWGLRAHIADVAYALLECSTLWLHLHERWLLLGDADAQKCSPTHLIGLKCRFKLNSLGAEITTPSRSAEQQHGCWMGI